MVRYVIALKRGVAQKDAGDWKEIVKNTQGVTVLGRTSGKRLQIEAGFDAIGVIRHKLGGICEIERYIEHHHELGGEA